MRTSLVRPRSDAAPMRVSEQRCEVCCRAADVTQTSAHLARVHWFCSMHGQQFHTSMYFAAARSASSTVECWALVDAWLVAARETWRSRSSVGSWLAWARAAIQEARRNRLPENRITVVPDPLDDVTLNGMAWLATL